MVLGLETKVECPKCKKTFMHTFVPGGAMTSVRLGRYRYMKCPKCKKYSKFDLFKHLDEDIKAHLPISQALNGVVLGLLGITSFVMSNNYQYVHNAFIALRVLGVLSIVLAILVLVGLYVYIEREPQKKTREPEKKARTSKR
jgi:hypothetical protein